MEKIEQRRNTKSVLNCRSCSRTLAGLSCCAARKHTWDTLYQLCSSSLSKRAHWLQILTPTLPSPTSSQTDTLERMSRLKKIHLRLTLCLCVLVNPCSKQETSSWFELDVSAALQLCISGVSCHFCRKSFCSLCRYIMIYSRRSCGRAHCSIYGLGRSSLQSSLIHYTHE